MGAPLTLQQIVEDFPRFGARRAAGLRDDLGLRWWSYARLYDSAHWAAASLRDRQVGKGDRILIRGRNSPEWVAFFFGAMLRGAVIVPLDYDSTPELIERITAVVQPKLSVGPEDLHAFFTPSSHRDATVPVAPSDAAIVFYTSGTTAEPRGLELTHANVVAQAAVFRLLRPIAHRVPTRMLVMAPFSHAQGFVLGIVIPLSLGQNVIYTHLTHPGHLIRTLRDNRVLIFSTVPRVLHVLARMFESQPYSKSRETLGDKLRRAKRELAWRHFVFTHTRRALGYSTWVVLVGGAPLPESDERFWGHTGCRIVQGYGLTEATAIVSVNFPFGSFGSVGRPVGGQEVVLADDGEVLVRGPNVAGDGLLRTGDIGRIDKRSRLFIVGRKKEVIVTGEGFNVYASDVEAVLNRLPDVEDSVVLGVDREGHTEVHAVLLMRDANRAGEAIGIANRDLLSHQRIVQWSVWPERDFPRSTLLKPKRAEIVERLLRPAIAAAPSERRTLAEVLKLDDRHARLAELARCIAEGSVGDGANLELARDLGLSSLDAVELTALLERHAARPLDGLAFRDDVTLSQLHELMRSGNDQKLDPLDVPDSPRWPVLAPFQLLRRLINPPLMNAVVRPRARLSVSGVEHLRDIDGPAIFAAAGHEHGFDVLLVYLSLPVRLRRRLAAVMSRWIFTYYLKRDATTPLAYSVKVGLAFHLAPILFPMILSAPFARSREALMHACWLIDRGYSVLAFDGRGMAAVARQCGVPIVPVRLTSATSKGFLPPMRVDRPAVSVSFAKPIRAESMSEDELIRTLDDFYGAVPSRS